MKRLKIGSLLFITIFMFLPSLVSAETQTVNGSATGKITVLGNLSPTTESTTESTDTTDSTEIPKKEVVIPPSNSGNSGGGGSYPQTGEVEQKWILSMIGLIMIFLVGLLLISYLPDEEKQEGIM